uniref:Mab-21-like HhH/H2TH-like domain-containing protein n=1 Tax=Anoplophora glabripennis TaxID=217634 RepID=V5I8Q6_ANOGL
MKAQKRPEPRKRYVFPTQRMISEIENLNCVLVPKGYVRKKGEHTDSDLEWEIQFPQAERYIETFMSHAQAKCYLFLLTLHKTYIEPDTFQLGLLAEHIRSFMLWECEANYSDWPEHRLGTKLVTLITSLNIHIAKSDLRDFFIKEKNVFENIPKKYLRHAQKMLHEVLEAPVMSFIKSLRNLRYTRGKHFYHPFEFDQLYDILIKTGIQSTNPQLISDMHIPPNFKKIRHLDTDIQVKHFKEAQKRERILKKRQEEIEKKNLKKEEEERRGSIDSVDLKWTCDRQFDVYKTRALLIFFINNFIEIAKKCSQISSHRQTLLYLKQARYLTRIMKDECPALEVEEQEYVKQIQALEDECNKKAVREKSSPRVVQNGGVHFSTNTQISNSSNNNEACSSTEKVPKVNGVVKPRKSVMFVESH